MGGIRGSPAMEVWRWRSVGGNESQVGRADRSAWLCREAGPRNRWLNGLGGQTLLPARKGFCPSQSLLCQPVSENIHTAHCILHQRRVSPSRGVHRPCGSSETPMTREGLQRGHHQKQEGGERGHTTRYSSEREDVTIVAPGSQQQGP